MAAAPGDAEMDRGGGWCVKGLGTRGEEGGVGKLRSPPRFGGGSKDGVRVRMEAVHLGFGGCVDVVVGVLCSLGFSWWCSLGCCHLHQGAAPLPAAPSSRQAGQGC